MMIILSFIIVKWNRVTSDILMMRMSSFSAIEERKGEFGEEEFGSLEYFTEEDEFGDENSSENFDGYNIKEDGDEDDF